jgi:hypothetical protein
MIKMKLSMDKGLGRGIAAQKSKAVQIPVFSQSHIYIVEYAKAVKIRHLSS